LANVLGPIGVDEMLVDERRIAVGEGVVGQLIHKGAAFAGGIGLSVRFQAEARPLQTASRANG
jgi:hypothetical protein